MNSAGVLTKIFTFKRFAELDLSFCTTFCNNAKIHSHSSFLTVQSEEEREEKVARDSTEIKRKNKEKKQSLNSLYF